LFLIYLNKGEIWFEPVAEVVLGVSFTTQEGFLSLDWKFLLRENMTFGGSK